MKRALPEDDAAAGAKRPDVPAFRQFEELLPELQGEVRRRLDLPTRAALARTCRAMRDAPDALPRLPVQWRAVWNAVPPDRLLAWASDLVQMRARLRRGFRRLLEAGLGALVLRRPWHLRDDGIHIEFDTSIVWASGPDVLLACDIDTDAWTLTVAGQRLAIAHQFTALPPEAVALAQ
jgi:hypothetical protein